MNQLAYLLLPASINLRRLPRGAPIGYRTVVKLAAVSAAVAFLSLAAAVPAHAGGGPQNVVLIVDPEAPDGLHVANYYRAARGIPPGNVIYMPPGAANYQAFTRFQLPALKGTLANRQIDDHIDYVVVAPGSSFYISAPNLVLGNACSHPVGRFAISAAYGLAFVEDQILAEAFSSMSRNHYHAPDATPRAFSSHTAWFNGAPSTSPAGQRFFLGFQLGYTGARGNTVDELLTMIDRSVAADGARPEGTFYYMETEDTRRSGPRVPHFPNAIQELQRLGARAEQLQATLPADRHDAIGVMTGAAGPRIEATDMTLLEGSAADHLTSFAGRFDTGSQVKLSRWIAKGASGSVGTVEEPCAMRGNPGKFPHPLQYVWYYQGLSLGESYFRSIPWMPFQTLLYGDPLTQPFAGFPTVDVSGVPLGAASGTVVLRPQANASSPERQINALELYVDGVRHSRVGPRSAFVLETDALADGYHELRVVAYEDELVMSQGAWNGSLMVDNLGRSVSLELGPSMDSDRFYTAVVRADGGDFSELRLLQGARVLAASAEPEAELRLEASRLGAGPVELVAVAEFADGNLAFSPPASVEVDPGTEEPADPPGPGRPQAHGYSLDVLPGQPVLVDLPASDPDGDAITVTVSADLAAATLDSDGSTWLLTPDEEASGQEAFSYRASDGVQESVPATVTIRYCTPPDITLEPSDQEVCPGDPAGFRVAAEGGNLRYRWFKNGYPIPGATGATFRLDRAKLSDEAFYRAEATRLCGTLKRAAVSREAALVVLEGDDRCRTEIWLPFAAKSFP